MHGDRLSQLASFEDLKLAAAAVLLSPFLPLLFMGEEYGERAPFQYFISHTDPKLVEAVRQGRREEFSSFDWLGEVPDPQAEPTFLACKLNWQVRLHGEHKVLYQFYRELIQLRKQLSAIASSDKPTLEVRALEAREVLILHYKAATDEVCLILCFANKPVCTALELPSGLWNKLLDSAEDRWRGAGSSLPARLCAGGQTEIRLPPRSMALFRIVQPRQ
jgi:maltooligosyltrehalose trehalohydrolase